MSPHMLYGWLGVHVGLDDAGLMSALDAWADRVPGRLAAITEHHRNLIRAEHAEAGALYADVMGGTI